MIEPRKIIQLVCLIEGKLVALCDDGTIWVKMDIWVEMSQKGLHDDYVDYEELEP